MRISSFNINKFCGPYSNTGRYYNPRNIDFRTPIKNIVEDNVKSEYDIFFLEAFTNNRYIKATELFKDYDVFYNGDKLTESHVVAITLRDSLWTRITPEEEDYQNKYIEMELKIEPKIRIICFHNADNGSGIISSKITKSFHNNYDIILGDFNNEGLVVGDGYRDLVTSDMITFKPAQTTTDHIYVRTREEFHNKVVFYGVTETFASDHNMLTFSLNVETMP